MKWSRLPAQGVALLIARATLGPELSSRAVKRAVTAVVTAALLAGCGSDDDAQNGDTAAETTPDTSVQTTAPVPDAAVFRADGVGFTFEYPKEYVRGEPPGV